MNDNLKILDTAVVASGLASIDLDNPFYKGAHVALTVTASGVLGGSIVMTVEGKDELSDSYYTLGTGTAVGTGTTIVKVYPGLVVSGNAFNDHLPRTWRVKTAHTGAATYGIAASLLD